MPQRVTQPHPRPTPDWLGYGRPYHMARDLDEFIFGFNPYGAAPTNLRTRYVEAPPDAVTMGNGSLGDDGVVWILGDEDIQAADQAAADQASAPSVKTWVAFGLLVGLAAFIARR